METVRKVVSEHSLVNGPSKWDLIIRALAEGQEAWFTDDQGSIFVAKVEGVGVANASKETWNVSGHCRPPDSDYPHPFDAWYRTDRRTGHLKLGESICGSVTL